MVVVIARSYGAHGHHTVLATFILLEAEFLIESVVGHHNKIGCMIESIRSKTWFHLGRESKRLGVVNLRKKHLCRIGGQFCIVGVDEQIGFLWSNESDDAILLAHLLVGFIEHLGEVNTAKCKVTILKAHYRCLNRVS